MTVYALAQISITDRGAYTRYQSRFMDVFRKFNGRVLAAEEGPRVIEGAWERDKVILPSFPDAEAFEAWAQSPDYLDISKDRHAGSDGVVLLINGTSS